jgi:hypothetical protein
MSSFLFLVSSIVVHGSLPSAPSIGFFQGVPFILQGLELSVKVLVLLCTDLSQLVVGMVIALSPCVAMHYEQIVP